MHLHDRRSLKQGASQALAHSRCDHKKLVLIYSASALGLTLLVTILDFILSEQIGNTGGLSGMGLRSILSTAQVFLRVLQMIAIPFWEMGYFYCVLRMARREICEPVELLQGFRKFAPIFRWYLLRTFLYLAAAIVCFFLSNQIFALTPLSLPLQELMQPYTEEFYATGMVPVLDEATMSTMMEAYIPMLIIFGILYLLAIVPITYLFRLSGFALLDLPKRGARIALRNSFRMMRGNCLAFFRLDLSFWWYYGLQALLSVVAYGDVLLPLLGISLPWSSSVSFFLFYLLFMAGQFALDLLIRNRVEVTYALAYDSLHEPIKPEAETPQAPKNPWHN